MVYCLGKAYLCGFLYQLLHRVYFIQSDILRSKNIPYLTLLFDFPESFIRTLCFRHEVFFYMLKAEGNLISCSKVFFLVLVMTTRTGGEWTDDKDVMFQAWITYEDIMFQV